jgi:[ribosomal protein S18]-alanine N-acetyltransferase
MVRDDRTSSHSTAFSDEIEIFGRQTIRFMRDETGGYAANLWTCVSDWNHAAVAFYRKHGFEPLGPLPDLVAPG